MLPLLPRCGTDSPYGARGNRDFGLGGSDARPPGSHRLGWGAGGLSHHAGKGLPRMSWLRKDVLGEATQSSVMHPRRQLCQRPAGATGVLQCNFSTMALPEPLRWHCPRRVPAPRRLSRRWDLEVYLAPYSQRESSQGFLIESPGVPMDHEPIGGPILLATPKTVDPNSLPEISWFQGTYPWMSLAVRAPRGLNVGLLGSALTRLARGGAIVLPGGASPADAAYAVRHVFEPAMDVLRWLGHATPGWRDDARAKAVHQLCEGLQESMLPGGSGALSARLASRTKLWTQVGRALYAARVIQSSGTVPAERLRTGYHDGRSLRRALQRAFGLRIKGIRGTVGWRWLLWRFLCGARTGKIRAWDRNL